MSTLHPLPLSGFTASCVSITIECIPRVLHSIGKSSEIISRFFQVASLPANSAALVELKSNNLESRPMPTVKLHPTFPGMTGVLGWEVDPGWPICGCQQTLSPESGDVTNGSI